MRRSCVLPAAALAAISLLGVCLQPRAAAQDIGVAADTMLGFWGGGQGAPPALIEVPDAKSPETVGNFFGGAWVEFPVTATKAGWYRVSIEHGADTGQNDSYITLDTRAKDSETHYVSGPQTLPNSGGWTAWVTTDLDVLVPLWAGENVLRVQNIARELRRQDISNDYDGGGVNLTWFGFTFERDLEAMGTISGTVTSSDLQIPVGFARVTTGDVATPHDWWIKDWWTKADDQGNYTLQVPAGTYTVTAFRADTYKPNRVSGVQVTAGQTAQAAVQLQSNWENGSLKQYSRDVDTIIPGGATGFYDETRFEPVTEGEDIENTRIVTGWWDANDWTEQLVDVAETGWYRIVFEYSTGTIGPLNVRYSANGTAADSDLEGNGNWREYLVSEPNDIPNPVLLIKGTNRLRLTMLPTSVGFNESFHILTRTTGPAVGTITGKVVPIGGKVDPLVEVEARGDAGNSVGVVNPDGTYSMYAPVGTYTLSISDVLGYRIGDQEAGVQVTENQVTTAPDLTYRILPFFIGVDPTQPASRPLDDDFAGTTLNSKWTRLNLGDELDGDAQVDNGVLTTTATQTDFWGVMDSGHYVYQTVSGDFIAYVRLLSVPTFEDMGDWSKHGLMVRLDESSGSAHFMILGASGRRTITEWRAESDGPTSSGAQPSESYRPGEWLRLIRKGGDFSAAWSYDADGANYTVAVPILTSLPSFADQAQILLGIGDTTGLSAVGVPAEATYSTFRVIPYQEAIDSLPPPVEPPPAGVKGDANQNGRLEVTDVIAVLRHVAGLAPLTGAGLLAADVNGNGVNITDAVAMLRAVAGIAPLP